METTAGPNADRRFVDYYSKQSQSAATAERFESVKRTALALRSRLGQSTAALSVADIGCGPGAQSILWAADGHRVYGIDISVPLIELARERAKALNLNIEFEAANAERLPLPDESCDVVLVPELLEHLSDWKPCVDEVVRVLKPGGIVYFCTTSRLCPKQHEYTLPLYSWYPSWLKRRCERMAVTSHPQWVQFTSFPAVHWFSFYGLRSHLHERGVTALDRFDVMDAPGTGLKAKVLRLVRNVAALRFLGHIATPYTLLYGVKR